MCSIQWSGGGQLYPTFSLVNALVKHGQPWSNLVTVGQTSSNSGKCASGPILRLFWYGGPQSGQIGSVKPRSNLIKIGQTSPNSGKCAPGPVLRFFQYGRSLSDQNGSVQVASFCVPTPEKIPGVKIGLWHTVAPLLAELLIAMNVKRLKRHSILSNQDLRIHTLALLAKNCMQWGLAFAERWWWIELWDYLRTFCRRIKSEHNSNVPLPWEDNDVSVPIGPCRKVRYMQWLNDKGGPIHGTTYVPSAKGSGLNVVRKLRPLSVVIGAVVRSLGLESSWGVISFWMLLFPERMIFMTPIMYAINWITWDWHFFFLFN